MSRINKFFSNLLFGSGQSWKPEKIKLDLYMSGKNWETYNQIKWRDPDRVKVNDEEILKDLKDKTNKKLTGEDDTLDDIVQIIENTTDSKEANEYKELFNKFIDELTPEPTPSDLNVVKIGVNKKDHEAQNTISTYFGETNTVKFEASEDHTTHTIGKTVQSGYLVQYVAIDPDQLSNRPQIDGFYASSPEFTLKPKHLEGLGGWWDTITSVVSSVGSVVSKVLPAVLPLLGPSPQLRSSEPNPIFGIPDPDTYTLAKKEFGKETRPGTIDAMINDIKVTFRKLPSATLEFDRDYDSDANDTTRYDALLCSNQSQIPKKLKDKNIPFAVIPPPLDALGDLATTIKNSKCLLQRQPSKAASDKLVGWFVHDDTVLYQKIIKEFAVPTNAPIDVIRVSSKGGDIVLVPVFKELVPAVDAFLKSSNYTLPISSDVQTINVSEKQSIHDSLSTLSSSVQESQDSFSEFQHEHKYFVGVFKLDILVIPIMERFAYPVLKNNMIEVSPVTRIDYGVIEYVLIEDLDHIKDKRLCGVLVSSIAPPKSNALTGPDWSVVTNNILTSTRQLIQSYTNKNSSLTKNSSPTITRTTLYQSSPNRNTEMSQSVSYKSPLKQY